MNHLTFNRRDFVKTSLAGALVLAAGIYPFTNPPVVSVIKIKNGNIKNAVDEAIRLIGGVDKVLTGIIRFQMVIIFYFVAGNVFLSATI